MAEFKVEIDSDEDFSFPDPVSKNLVNRSVFFVKEEEVDKLYKSLEGLSQWLTDPSSLSFMRDNSKAKQLMRILSESIQESIRDLQVGELRDHRDEIHHGGNWFIRIELDNTETKRYL